MTISTADTVTTTLQYFSPPHDGSKPYIHINADPSTGKRIRNWETVSHEREIENVRGKEHSVSLDTTGFQYYKRAVPHTTFENDEVIEKEYYPQSIELLKELTGASRAVRTRSRNFDGLEFLPFLVAGLYSRRCDLARDIPTKRMHSSSASCASCSSPSISPTGGGQAGGRLAAGMAPA